MRELTYTLVEVIRNRSCFQSLQFLFVIRGLRVCFFVSYLHFLFLNILLRLDAEAIEISNKRMKAEMDRIKRKRG